MATTNKALHTAGMMQVVYVDSLGRKSLVAVPQGGESHPERGIVLGPPDLSELGMTEEQTTALHNELFSRGILTYRDARRRRDEIMSSLMTALRVSAEQIMVSYKEQESAV